MIEHTHQDHRSRLRQKFRLFGLEAFAEHEIVELLLFYAIPRKNTNDIAHALVDRFGNLRGILSAPPQQLCQVTGISEQSALFLQLLLQTYGHFRRQDAPQEMIYRTAEDVLPLARNHYADKTGEHPLILLLDSQFRKVDLIALEDGILTAGQLATNQVTRAIFSREAAAFVLIHNHPNGDATPSQNDLFLTNRWYHLFQSLGCPMLEHLIVTKDDYYPILTRQHGLSGLGQNLLADYKA